MMPQILRLYCWVLLASLWPYALAHATVQPLEQAEFRLDPATAPPAETRGWHPVALPDHWRNSRPDVYGQGWYRFHFRADNPGIELQAVYLPRISMNAAVFINGVEIGNGGRFTEPIGRNWNRPLLFLIPPHTLRPGHNVLHLRLLAPHNSQAVLAAPLLGDEKQLREIYERTYFMRITLNQTASLLIAGIGILMLSLWWRRRQDTAYGLFAAAALIWALQSINLYLTQAPVTTPTWEVLVNATFSMIAALLLTSLLRFTHTDWRGLRHFLRAMLILAPLSMALAPNRYFLDVTVFWHFLAVLATAATLALLARAALRGNRDARYLLASVGLVLLFGAHDWLMHSKTAWMTFLVRWSGQEFFLLQFAAPLLFLTMAWIMTIRYVSVLNDFEALNSELEERVAAKHRELESHFSRIREMHKEQALLEERERIYQDLHDDVGAKLLSLVYRSENPNNVDLARSALQDLRDVVSRTTAEQFQLEDAIADWRAECEQRLKDSGLRLEWQADTAIADYRLTQPQALNLGRILREGVSNIIRHAQATHVSVKLEQNATHLLLTIADDGVGLAPGTRPGRGFSNMQRRAQRLGGQFSQTANTPHGLVLHVQLPLHNLARTPASS